MNIRPLNRSQEKALLASMLGKMKEPIDNRFSVRLKRQIIAFALPFSMAFLFLATLRTGSLLAAITTVSALLIGIAITSCAYRITSIRQWPVLDRCLDRAEIERRLRELDV